MALTGLHMHDSPQIQEGPEVQGNVNVLQDKVKELDKALQNVTDMMGAIKGQSGSEILVVEMGGDIFKGKGGVHAWIEENLPTNHPFGVFVDVDVVLELILLGYTNVQVATMERNQKLQLEADKAL
eukprot:1474986-Ditylum_brightwellii.AAC.1